jgi:hypothetical protein
MLVVFVGYTVFALCFQGTFYLFEYRNGDTIAPTYIKLQKDLIWTIVLSIVFYIGVIQARKIGTLLQPYNVILLSFCCWVVAVKVVELLAYGSSSVLLLLTVKNLVLYAAMVPVLGMLGMEIKRCLVKQVLVVLVAVSFVQAAFSAGLFISFSEYAFWRDDPYYGFNPFVGLFSNPNRFGLFLNLGAAVLCTVLVTSSAKRSLFAAVGLLGLALSIFYTAALSQLVVYFGILSYATAIVAWKMRWRCLRLPAVIVASILAIGLVGFNFKSPLPDESHKEAALAWDLRNMASLTLHGKTLDGEPFQFTSDTFVNRAKELADLWESFGLQNAQSGRASGDAGAKSPLQQRLFGRPEQMAPASQSQFAYIYFRYGLVGLLFFVLVLAIPAVRGVLVLMRRDTESNTDQMLLSYHLSLVAFIATFLGDNGLLDFPTNFLLFFVLFANQSLVDRADKVVISGSAA